MPFPRSSVITAPVVLVFTDFAGIGANGKKMKPNLHN